MQIQSFGITDLGKKRKQNEDSFLINEDLHLYVVADGMGGHRGGGYASRNAVEKIEEIIKSICDDPDSTLQTNEDIDASDYKGQLRYAVNLASDVIYERANDDPTLKGMGTTTVGALLRDNRIYIGNVGDSRAYRIRDEKIQQLTTDHSLVEEQVKAGLLSADSARTHKLRNIITRSVGFQRGVNVDVIYRALKENDYYLLCSDGLTNMLEDKEILEIVKGNGPRSACQQLIDIANERGGEDNITVVIIHVEHLSDNVSTDEDDEMTVEM